MKSLKISGLLLTAIVSAALMGCGDDKKKNPNEAPAQDSPASTSPDAIPSTAPGGGSSSGPGGGAITGTWAGLEEGEGNVAMQLTVKFDSNSIEIRSVCELDGKQSQVAIKVNAKFSNGRIDILESKNAKTRANGVPCEVNLEKGTINYQVQGDTLVMMNQAREQLVLQRVR